MFMFPFLKRLEFELATLLRVFVDLVSRAKESLKSLAGGLFSQQLSQLEPSQLDSKYLTKAGQYVLKGVSSLFSFLFVCFLIFFLTFFMLNDQRIIKNKLLNAFGSGQTAAPQSILTEINNQIRAFIQVKFWTTVVLSVIFTLGLLLLGVKYPYIWG